MKQSQAIAHLRILLTATQKAASIAAEGGRGAADDFITPSWASGRKSIVPAVAGLLDRIDAGNTAPLTPGVFYNFMVIANGLEPVIAVAGAALGHDLPNPDTNWLRGWEPE